MIDIIIGIQNMGPDTGPTFDLYSDLDGYQVPFEINVSKVDLLVGYNTTAPTGSTIIRVKSKGECETYIDIPILEPTTTTTTTLPPETTTTTTTTTSTTTTTTSTTTLPPDTTTTTTVLNKELIITNVEWDLSEGMYLVYFTSNFALTQLAIQTSSNGINWSAPELFNDLSTPQLFIPVPHFNTFYVRLFDSNLGDITYSNVYQYFVPLPPSTTTTTTTTTPPSGGGGCCLVSGTKISLYNDDVKNIEDVVIGDIVYSYDFENNKIVESLVTNTFNPIKRDIIKISLDNNTFIECTTSHPLWSLNRCNWVSMNPYITKEFMGIDALKLNIDDVLMDINNNSVNITNIEFLPENGIVTYDISVEPYNNYFANNILVHNKIIINPMP